MRFVLPLLLALLLPVASVAAADGFVDLFDGKTLDGWTPTGNAEAWAVEDGAIVIRPGKHGGWLRTTRQYRDFELHMDFMVSKGANSGVSFRCSSLGDPAFTGMEIQILDSHGQEPSETNCGAVYDAIAPSAMAVRPAGEWNTYRIRVIGDRIDAWLNDVRIHENQRFDDRGYIHRKDNPSPLRDRLTTGYIAMQDHGQLMKFRNLRIYDMSPDPDPGDFKPIFNGRDLDGWFKLHDGTWSAEGGMLVGRDGPGHLFSDGTWGDMEMRAQVRVNTNGNSGFYFRTVPNPDQTVPWPVGHEAQVDQHDPKNFTGCVYNKAWPQRLLTRDNAWFDYRVRAEGNHIQTWINGVPMVDAMLDEHDAGHLALQTHHPGNEIRWRDIQVRELAPKSDAFSLLVFSKTAGFRHRSIEAGVESLRALGQHEGFTVAHTEDAAEFTAANLDRFDVVCFLNTTGDVLNDEQQAAFESFVQGGGGYVGVHSAADTEYDWPWYGKLMGAYFKSHPAIQQANVNVEDATHPSTRHLRTPWPRRDEWYNYRENPRPRVRVLLSLDTASYQGSDPMDDHPIAWCHEFDGGRAWYTGGGHTIEAFSEPGFMTHVLGGLRWAAGVDDTAPAGSR